jgi:hypothetical protein
MARQGGFGVQLKITVSATLTAVANLVDVDFPKFKKFIAEAKRRHIDPLTAQIKALRKEHLENAEIGRKAAADRLQDSFGIIRAALKARPNLLVNRISLQPERVFD